MLDREGYRPNVGIILVNQKNEVFWGKRIREHSWQFPQGGIKYGETPVQAMYRELQEEVGLKPEHVRILGRTRDWLRYNVPDNFIRRDSRGHYKGQKQIWFLLRLVGKDTDVSLRATHHPEFDAWRWHTYWVPLDVVIEFKRDVYHRALKELSDILFRRQGESRFLRHRNGAAAGNRKNAGRAQAGNGKAEQIPPQKKSQPVPAALTELSATAGKPVNGGRPHTKPANKRSLDSGNSASAPRATQGPGQKPGNRHGRAAPGHTESKTQVVRVKALVISR